MEKVMVPGSEALVGGWQELKATVALDAQRRNRADDVARGLLVGPLLVGCVGCVVDPNCRSWAVRAVLCEGKALSACPHCAWWKVGAIDWNRAESRCM